jgi:hypothetical protein
MKLTQLAATGLIAGSMSHRDGVRDPPAGGLGWPLDATVFTTLNRDLAS